ncbi:MAG: glutamate-1-semialdehyde 2,1-aminomutase [Lachnospiraceae bacterium]|nr:glutamate-1-semialdehyde 2,1-aminomutase [Lachnospiraceae bacterium]
MSQNEVYAEKAHRLIPGGAHTYSRTDETFAWNAPKVIEKGKGAYCWDVDGNKWLDFSMACRSVTVGYNYERISQAAIAQILNGNTATKASKIEIEAAELMIDLIPWVDMVKFAKNGSTVTSAATKLARAYTGKKYILRCREHSFFSYDDWFIGDTVCTRGIPEEISNLTLQFSYNDISSVKKAFEEHKDEIACMILEPVEFEEPKDDFLQKAKDICHKNGAVFILDEMISGFRWHLLGASKYYGVEPDLVTYGKGMANGFSMAALGGKREIMELGGIEKEGEERVFLVSTTHGAEMSSLGAFVETMKVYQELNVVDRLWDTGRQIQDGIRDITIELGIQDKVYTEGAACSFNIATLDIDGKPSSAYRTLLFQEMAKKGILMNSMSLCYEHGAKEIEIALDAFRSSLRVYRDALECGINAYLQGPVIKAVFRKYN